MIAPGRLALIVLIWLVMGGCRLSGRAIERGPAPPYPQAAERYNTGRAGLDRLWARATVRAKYLDPDGRSRSEQGEGHLQCILPDRFALNVGKVGETFAYLGCDDERFWWFKLHDRKEAWVGVVGQPLGDGSAIPIHPRDAALLLGLSTLDPTRGASAWSEDGRSLILETTAERGTLAVWVDPVSFRPSRVEIKDADGLLIAWSTIKGDQEVFAPGTPGSPRVYREITLHVPTSQTEIRLSLGEPQSTRSKPVEAAFDLDRLLDAYGIEVVHSLNEPGPP